MNKYLFLVLLVMSCTQKEKIVPWKVRMNCVTQCEDFYSPTDAPHKPCTLDYNGQLMFEGCIRGCNYSLWLLEKSPHTPAGSRHGGGGG